MRTRLTLVKALMRAAMVPIAALLVGCQPEGLVYDPQSGQWVSPLPTATSSTSPLPTSTVIGDIEPTLSSSPTPPPVPTLPPTPIVTPIPTAVPPIIPEVVGKTPQPFWIIYWQDDEVWRIDDKGQARQLLLDTYQSLKFYLTANPNLESLVDTKQQSRVKVSPDGQKLALVVVDKAQRTQKGEPVAFSIYLFDIQTGNLEFISEGASPEWSPDGKRIAFLKNLTPDGTLSDGGLWIVDLETDQIYKLIEGDPSNPLLHVSYWIWSPDSQQITYRYREGMVDKPEIWIKSVTDSLPPYLVPNISKDIFYNCVSWTPDGQSILCAAPDQSALYPLPTNLWVISVNTGEKRQLTQHFTPFGAQWSPDGRWLAISAASLYEKEESLYDIWLLSADGTELLRATAAQAQDNNDAGNLGGYWSPDGIRLVFRRTGIGLASFSLQTGEIVPLGVNLVDLSSYNYAIGDK